LLRAFGQIAQGFEPRHVAAGPPGAHQRPERERRPEARRDPREPDEGDRGQGNRAEVAILSPATRGSR
jgi:hypothetical protein